MRTSLLVLAIVGLTACSSSSSSSSSGGDQGDVPCTITLSGAVSKTLTCNSSAGFTTADNVGSLNLTTIGGQEAVFTFSVSGDLQSTTYTWSNSKVQETTVIENGSTWTAEMAKQLGSSSLTISGLTVDGTSAEGKLYIPHGSVTATLVGQGGATGQVTFSASF